MQEYPAEQSRVLSILSAHILFYIKLLKSPAFGSFMSMNVPRTVCLGSMCASLKALKNVFTDL